MQLQCQKKCKTISHTFLWVIRAALYICGARELFGGKLFPKIGIYARSKFGFEHIPSQRAPSKLSKSLKLDPQNSVTERKKKLLYIRSGILVCTLHSLQQLPVTSFHHAPPHRCL